MTFAPDTFRGQRFGVLGLGRNGLPVARALAAMGADVAAWDDNVRSSFGLPPPPWPLNVGEGKAAEAPPSHRPPPINVGRTTEGEAAEAPPPHRGGGWGEGATEGRIRLSPPDPGAIDALVLSPGIPHRLPKPHPIAAACLAAGVPILSDADLLYRAVRANGSRARFAGVTGTNGKSTTTALLAHVLEVAGIPVAAGGNLGTPALALASLPHHGVYVLEMSSYMLERLATLTFDVAAMLNLSPDHLDRHGDMAGYAAAKAAIFDRQDAGCTAVVGVDDAHGRAMAATLDGRQARVVRISAADPPHPGLAGARALPGRHNAQNAAAAVAMARALGVDEAAIERGLRSFPGLPHRQERVGEVAGVSFVNDSKATNADSTATALACFDRVVWIAGGLAKAGGIAALAPLFPRVAHAVLIGRDAPMLAETLAAHGVPHETSGTLEAAVPAAMAAARALSAPAVLLSPACASFDQFSGFDARGDRFRVLVRELA